jgi:hypothetical protein
VIVTDEAERIWKEAAVVYFKVFHHFPGGNEEYIASPVRRPRLAAQNNWNPKPPKYIDGMQPVTSRSGLRKSVGKLDLSGVILVGFEVFTEVVM